MEDGYYMKRILRLPHGFFQGEITEVAPTITTSSFEHNNFVLEVYEDKDL